MGAEVMVNACSECVTWIMLVSVRCVMWIKKGGGKYRGEERKGQEHLGVKKKSEKIK